MKLTYGVDVKKADRCAKDGVEHTVVHVLCTPHHYIEQEHIPGKAKDDGGCSQTCKNNQNILQTSTADMFTWLQHEHSNIRLPP